MNLEWKEMEKGPGTWWQAKSLENESFRLPTLQELKNADDKGVLGFNSSYFWTNDDKEGEWIMAWYYIFGSKQSGTLHKNMYLSIRLCREIK